MLLAGSNLALLLVSLATLATVVITLSVPPAALRPPHKVLKIGAGCCSSPSSALVRLRGGSFNAGAGAPWKEAFEEGGVHAEAGNLESAIASYTRGLQYDSTPPDGAAILYYIRALVLLQQESFGKASEDARAGLAIFSGGELLNSEGEEPEIKQRLIVIAIEAPRRNPSMPRDAVPSFQGRPRPTRPRRVGAAAEPPPRDPQDFRHLRCDPFLQRQEAALIEISRVSPQCLRRPRSTCAPPPCLHTPLPPKSRGRTLRRANPRSSQWQQCGP